MRPGLTGVDTNVRCPKVGSSRTSHTHCGGLSHGIAHKVAKGPNKPPLILLGIDDLASRRRSYEIVGAQ